MKNLSLDFFGEKVSINMPTNLESLRKEISNKFMFDPSDTAELIISYVKDLGKKIISTEKDFENFLSEKILKLNLDINQNSKLFKESLNTIKEEAIKDKEELETLLKKKQEQEKLKSTKINEYKKKLKVIDVKIKKLKIQKIKEKRAMKQTIKKIQKNEKETNKKIAELQKKLCIQNPEKKLITKEEKKEQKNLPKKNIIKKAIFTEKTPKILTENSKKKEILKAKNLKKKTTNDSKKEVHWFISCDGCHAYPIYGKRFKCETCKDFDLCEKCYEKQKQTHNHSFKNVKAPSILLNNQKNFNANISNEKPVHKGVICNKCGMKNIIGNRFKCTICNDYDLCENCESKYGEEHLHPFIKVYDPKIMPISIKCEIADKKK